MINQLKAKSGWPGSFETALMPTDRTGEDDAWIMFVSKMRMVYGNSNVGSPHTANLRFMGQATIASTNGFQMSSGNAKVKTRQVAVTTTTTRTRKAIHPGPIIATILRRSKTTNSTGPNKCLCCLFFQYGRSH